MSTTITEDLTTVKDDFESSNAVGTETLAIRTLASNEATYKFFLRPPNFTVYYLPSAYGKDDVRWEYGDRKGYLRPGGMPFRTLPSQPFIVHTSGTNVRLRITQDTDHGPILSMGQLTLRGDGALSQHRMYTKPPEKSLAFGYTLLNPAEPPKEVVYHVNGQQFPLPPDKQVTVRGEEVILLVDLGLSTGITFDWKPVSAE